MVVNKEISVESARDLINKNEGNLLRELSILPALEIYELNDNTLIEIKVYTKKAYQYFNKQNAISEIKKWRLRSFFEDYENELKFFPSNVDQILKKLSEQLDIKIDTRNNEIDYLNTIDKKVRKYLKTNTAESIFLGLIVLIGEMIIHITQGRWQVEQVSSPYPHDEPFISVNNEKIKAFIHWAQKGLVEEKLSSNTIIAAEINRIKKT